MDRTSSPESITVVARLDCDRATARRLVDALAETFDSNDAAVAAFEHPDGGWSFEANFAQPPDEPALRALVGAIAGDAAADALVLETVTARDWVAASLAGLKPVAAGRFLVHGAHDRVRVPVHRIGIEIEAALAFGTGHHGTTRGCLLALDAWLKRRRSRLASPPIVPRKSELSHVTAHGVCAPSPPSSGGEGWGEGVHPRVVRLWRHPSPRPSPRKSGERERGRPARILDIGTGTGVLAIAAAKALHARVLASDIDRCAVEVARANARANAAGPLVDVVHAAGLTARRLRERGPFDLVLANILLPPLRRLAAPIARALAPGGHVILSGLLAAQAPAAIAAYRMQELELVMSIPLDEWVTLMLARRSTRKRRE